MLYLCTRGCIRSRAFEDLRGSQCTRLEATASPLLRIIKKASASVEDGAEPAESKAPKKRKAAEKPKAAKKSKK